MKHIINFTLFILVVCLTLNLFQICTNEEPPRVCQGKKLLCTKVNKKYFRNMTCWISLLNRTHESFSFDGYMMPKMQFKWLHTHIKSFYRFNVIYRQLLITIDDDVCALFGGRSTSFFYGPNLKLIGKKQKENVSKGCPYSERLYLYGLYLDRFAMADILPNGDWYLSLEFYTKEDGTEFTIFTLQLYFTCKYVGNAKPVKTI